MRQLPRELAAILLLLTGAPALALAQQGSVQVSAAAHTVHGNPERVGTQEPFEPDLGISWLRPSTRFGMFQMELRAITRDGDPHVGRAFLSIRDYTYRGVKYTLDLGDSYFSPAPGDYQHRNIFTPAVNFSGASFRAKTARLTMAMMAGRATATRNIFGTDTETLDQDLGIARGSYAVTDRLEISARAARIRTRDLKEFTFTIASSDQAGAGAKVVLTPALHLAADASVVEYRRRGSLESDTDASVFAGATFLLARGWVQVNASRFSPGELPILTQPLADRQALFAAAEYDVWRRVRLFGGWESYRSNLDESPVANVPPSVGSRGIAGIRVPLSARSSASLRVEEGDRRARYLGALPVRVSDTGVVSTEVQASRGPVTTFLRFAHRQSVESENVYGTFTQRDGTALGYVNLSRTLQFFASATAVRNTNASGAGHTLFQFGGGTQAQVTNRGLWIRAEGHGSRSVDLLSDRTVPQQRVTLGLNGEIARNTTIALTLYADRFLAGASPALTAWLARSSVRVTRTFASGDTRAVTAIGTAMARHSGTGTLNGIVFSDWNGNGVQDPGDQPLENIPVRLASLGNASTSRAGEFAFVNVPIGMQQVGIDLSSLPVDFDPPPVPHVQVLLGRGESRHLSFGLVPLGAITGRVVRDVNGNREVDAADLPLDGPVVVLNGGVRSEQVRAGRFRFDAVRTGDHRVTLLTESLPDGATIVGDAIVGLTIARDTIAPEATFVVHVQQRPEIRRVFTAEPSAPAAPPATPKPAPAGRAERPPARPSVPPLPRTSESVPPARAGRFTIQVAALNDPSRAATLIESLKRLGLAAYIAEPTSSDNNAPYRVRVGQYSTRAAAEADAAIIEQQWRLKVWIIAIR